MSDVEIEVRVVRDEPTDRAILVQETPSGPKIWLPRQVTRIEYADQRHERATVTIPEWFGREGRTDLMAKPKTTEPAPFITDDPDPPGVNTTELARYLDRVENVELEIRELQDGKKEIWQEMKGRGFDLKAARRAHALRKLKREDLAVLAVYVDALSIFE